MNQSKPTTEEPSSQENLKNQALIRNQQDMDSLRLLSRLVIGIVVLGGQELLDRLQALQNEIDTQSLELIGETHTSEKGSDILRYLLIGSIVRTQEIATQGARSTTRFTYRMFSSTYDRFAALTDNRFLRPIKRNVDNILANIEDRGRALVRKGRYEEQNARLLTPQMIEVILEDVLEYMAHNPELSDFIRSLLGSQTAGIATSFVDTGRQAGLSGDYLLEGIIRKIMRMTPRTDLPDSPIAGQPQTMYVREPGVKSNQKSTERTNEQ